MTAWRQRTSSVRRDERHQRMGWKEEGGRGRTGGRGRSRRRRGWSRSRRALPSFEKVFLEVSHRRETRRARSRTRSTEWLCDKNRPYESCCRNRYVMQQATYPTSTERCSPQPRHPRQSSRIPQAEGPCSGPAVRRWAFGRPLTDSCSSGFADSSRGRETTCPTEFVLVEASGDCCRIGGLVVE